MIFLVLTCMYNKRTSLLLLLIWCIAKNSYVSSWFTPTTTLAKYWLLTICMGKVFQCNPSITFLAHLHLSPSGFMCHPKCKTTPCAKKTMTTSWYALTSRWNSSDQPASLHQCVNKTVAASQLVCTGMRTKLHWLTDLHQRADKTMAHNQVACTNVQTKPHRTTS